MKMFNLTITTLFMICILTAQNHTDWRDEYGIIEGQLMGSAERFEGQTFSLQSVSSPDSSWDLMLKTDYTFYFSNLKPGYYRLTQKGVGRFTLLESILVKSDSLTILAPIPVLVDFEPLPPVPEGPIRVYLHDVSIQNEPWKIVPLYNKERFKR